MLENYEGIYSLSYAIRNMLLVGLCTLFNRNSSTYFIVVLKVKRKV
jgi:hypothetical protein